MGFRNETPDRATRSGVVSFIYLDAVSVALDPEAFAVFSENGLLGSPVNDGNGIDLLKEYSKIKNP